MSRRRATDLLIVVLLTALLAALLAAVPAAARSADYDVVGGRPSDPGAWPAQAALIGAGADDLADGFRCGGTLITPTLVLSAAHCVATSGGLLFEPPEALEVAVGVDDLSDPDATAVAVTAIYAHPEWDAFAFSNDLAVLELAEPVDAPTQTLAEPGDGLPAPGTTATVVGFGAVDADGTLYLPELREAEVPIADQAACADGYAESGIADLVPEVMVCAGDPSDDPGAPGADTCFGDSGGPLLVDDGAGGTVQIGITSFGGTFCGVDLPGVYARVDAMRGFVDAVVAGEVPPSEVAPGGLADVEPGDVIRVVGEQPDDPASLAVALSQLTFPIGPVSDYAVLGRVDDFPDALAGSALGFGVAPLLFTDREALQPEVAEELTRVVGRDGRVYLLGGVDALSPAVEDAVADLGLVPVRLAGATREETAAAVAAEVIAVSGGGFGGAFGTVLLATAGNWPDAVSAGQIAAWFGVPVLLTGPDALHPATEAALADLEPTRVLVIGGTAAISDAVAARVRALTGVPVDRLGGDTRIGTALAVAAEARVLVQADEGVPPGVVAVTNLYAPTGFVDALAASMPTGLRAGILLPTDPAGGALGEGSAAVACGLADVAPGLVVGTEDVVAEPVEGELAEVLAVSCG